LTPSDAQASLRVWAEVVHAVVTPAGGLPLETAVLDAPVLMFVFSGDRAVLIAQVMRVALSVRDAVTRTWREWGNRPEQGVAVLQVGQSVHVMAGEQPGSEAVNPTIGGQLLQLCLPGHIVVSSQVHDGVGQDMAWRDLGRIEIRSVAAGAPPGFLQAYTLGPAADVYRRSWAQRPAPYMIGRTHELSVLSRAFGRSLDHAGRVVGVCAEAGMGKSLLLAHFLRAAEYNHERIHVMSCSPDMVAREWFPLAVWLEDVLGFDADDESAVRFQKTQARLPWYASRDDVLLVAQFLGIPLPSDVAPLNLTPLNARMQLEALLRRWLKGEGPRQTILVVEDLHWCDSATLAFLASLAEASLLLVVTARPVAQALVDGVVTGVQWHHLAPQDRREMSQLMARVTQGKTLPPDVEATIVEQAAGNPLYLEEFTRAALSCGFLLEESQQWVWAPGAEGQWHPADFRQALAARLDRLGTARSVAMHASVIGRRFDVQSLAALLPRVPPPELASGINELMGAGMIHLVDPTRGEYEFRHALVQLAAYESVIQRERETMHARLAAHIEAELPDVAERQPALVARHLAEAGEYGRAARRWLAAGQLSLARSANGEAIAYVGEGLSLLKQLPQEERDALELALLTVMGPALIATAGFGSPLVGQNFARTRELCDAFAARPEVFPSLWGSWVFSLVRGRLRESCDYAQRMGAMVDSMGVPSLAIESLWTLGDSLYWLGDLTGAGLALDAACESYDATAHHAHATLFGQDPGVAASCYASLVCLHRGQPEAARQALDRAHAMARDREHAFSTSWALAFEHMFAMYHRDAAQAVAAARQSLQFCQEQGAPFWQAAGQIVLGWGLAMSGEAVQGLIQLREGMALYEAIGSNVVHPLWHALLAEALLQQGDVDAAAQAVQRGLALAESNEERLSEIELWIAQGDVCKARGDAGRAAAGSAYQQAATLSHERGAVLLAERAARRLLALG
jgi:tetratricopeptide (TPR) repeat protein